MLSSETSDAPRNARDAVILLTPAAKATASNVGFRIAPHLSNLKQIKSIDRAGFGKRQTVR